MDDRFEGEVANLHVKGELVGPHPAGADQHLVVLDPDQTVALDTEVGTGRSFVLLCPVQKHNERTNKCARTLAVHKFNVAASSPPSGGRLWYYTYIPARREKNCFYHKTSFYFHLHFFNC